MNLIIWIILGSIALVLILIIALYNNLIHLKLKANQFWDQIDRLMIQKLNLISYITEIITDNFTNSKELLKNIFLIKKQYEEETKIEEKEKLALKISNELNFIFNFLNANSTTKKNKKLIDLKNEIFKIDEKITYLKQFFFDAVHDYNRATIKFPSNIISKIFNFQKLNIE